MDPTYLERAKQRRANRLVASNNDLALATKNRSLLAAIVRSPQDLALVKREPPRALAL